MICDDRGTPPKVITTAANVNDVTQTLALVDGIPPVAGRPGRPRRRPDALLGNQVRHDGPQLKIDPGGVRVPVLEFPAVPRCGPEADVLVHRVEVALNPDDGHGDAAGFAAVDQASHPPRVGGLGDEGRGEDGADRAVDVRVRGLQQALVFQRGTFSR
ncbi:hypothetical protein [Streptomyces sp. NRRL F-2295]|uniref:hypothetical protein n=1 Tax=Streptomyces sp. NRRL F-2295 TaxID=1519477 RepID=UPI003B6400D4